MVAQGIITDSTDENRRRLRDGRILLAVRAGLVSRAFGVLSRMAVVAVAIRVLGAERYGLWVSIGSLVAWLGVSDLGLSSGIINAVSTALGKDNRAEARRHISTGYALFGLLGSLVVCLSCVLQKEPLLYRVLGVAQNTVLAEDSRVLFIFLTFVFALSLPVNVIVSVTNAFQHAYLASLAMTVAQGTTLLTLAVIVIGRFHSLLALVAAVSLPPLLANIGLSCEFFGRRQRDIRPSVSALSASSVRAVAATSAFVLLGQCGDLAIQYSSNLVVASHFGPSAVPQYSVPYSLFMVVQTLSNTLLGPLWPFYAEAAVRDDRVWIGQAFRSSLVRSMGVTIPLSIAIIAFGRPAIRLWAGQPAVPSFGVLFALACYFILWMLSAVAWMLAYGLGFFRLRALTSLTSAALFLCGSLSLVGSLGVLAIPLAGSAAMVVDCAIGLYSLQVWRTAAAFRARNTC